MWKKGLSSWEEYRNVVRTCRDATRKAKAHLEMKLAKERKDDTKIFFLKYVNSKRKTRDNVSPLLNEGGVRVTGDAEKVEILNAFFPSVFASKTQDSRILEFPSIWMPTWAACCREPALAGGLVPMTS